MKLNGHAPKSSKLTPTSIRLAYKRMAPVYDWLFGLAFEAGRRRAIEALAVKPGERVLEVGVGTGLSLRSWPRQSDVVGIDLSPDMLERADRAVRKHGLNNVQLHVMDAQATSFPESHFDAVAAMYVASVVPDLDALLREMRRVCKPGGRIAIVNHFEHPRPTVRSAERSLSRYAGVLGFNPALPLDRITGTDGLQVRRVQPVNWGGYWTLIEATNQK